MNLEKSIEELVVILEKKFSYFCTIKSEIASIAKEDIITFGGTDLGKQDLFFYAGRSIGIKMHKEINAEVFKSALEWSESLKHEHSLKSRQGYVLYNLVNLVRTFCGFSLIDHMMGRYCGKEYAKKLKESAPNDNVGLIDAVEWHEAGHQWLPILARITNQYQYELRVMRAKIHSAMVTDIGSNRYQQN